MSLKADLFVTSNLYSALVYVEQTFRWVEFEPFVCSYPDMFTATEHGYFKTLCCIPTFVLVLAVLLCIIAGVTLVALFGINSLTEIKYRAVNGVLIAMTVIVAVAVLSNAYTWARMLVNLVIPAKRRVQKIAANIDTLKMEGFMQALKKEVELISHMTLSMDSFQSAHTRLVVIVDGLDSCEQEKLLQVCEGCLPNKHKTFIQCCPNVGPAS